MQSMEQLKMHRVIGTLQSHLHVFELLLQDRNVCFQLYLKLLVVLSISRLHVIELACVRLLTSHAILHIASLHSSTLQQQNE
jgi:hypothetical protein